MRTKAIKSSWIWAETTFFIAGKNPELIFEPFFRLRYSGSSHSKKVETCSETSAEHPLEPSL